MKKRSFLFLTLIAFGFYNENMPLVPKPPKKVETAQDTQEAENFDDALYRWSRTFAEAAHLVNTKYYLTLDAQEAMSNAIKGFIKLDPHSKFLGPDEYKDIISTTHGEFCGAGVVLGPEGAILGVLPGSPAEEAGLQEGDKIVSIDDKPLKDTSTDEISKQIRGKCNTQVTLEIMRESFTEPKAFVIKRNPIKEENTFSYYFPEYGIYYINLSTFNQNSGAQVAALLKKAVGTSTKGIILDLRHNAGGLLNEAVKIAGDFLPKDSLVVVTKDRDKKIIERYMTTQEPTYQGGIPLVVLVDNGTASAAEILAGALIAHADKSQVGKKKPLMVFSVGTTTFGKGSVQEVIPLSNDCALKLTTSLYYLPDNRSIQAAGITPDFVIEKKGPPSKALQWLNKMYGKESALPDAIDSQKEESKKDEKEKPKDYKKKRKEALASDTQVQSAIHLINFYGSARPELVNTREKALNYLKKQLITNDTIAMEEIKL